MQTENTNTTERPPVVVIMGHIDHGKSTLLSYIRKSDAALNEAGGITQHISAYEVEHTGKDGKKHMMTFLDTPGHEAFFGIRKRGASVADIAILVVSAEDGVKPQTKEALNSILESKTPYIVAINKIDKPSADIEKTKQSLAENQIYIEGYGGDIPVVLLSAKTGEGVPELFDMIVLVAELEGLTGDMTLPGKGVVIESNRDTKKGISATCIVKDGQLQKGMYITSGLSIAPVRMLENYLGKPVESARFSSPIKVIGWDVIPEVGNAFVVHNTREEARDAVEKEKVLRTTKTLGGKNNAGIEESAKNFLPVVVKADTGSSLEALISEIKKCETENMKVKVIGSGIGAIGESDVRLADGSTKAVVIGFNTKIDSPAKKLAERNEVEIQSFDIIYKMNEWLKDALVTRAPKTMTLESIGEAKILKLFSKVKDRQILGGRVEKGALALGAQVKIMRHDALIGEGKVRELQQAKAKVTEVSEGVEFGAMIVSNIEMAPGDKIESFIIVEK